jgi:glycosyltransferase involved in cell wall biosynthesis
MARGLRKYDRQTADRVDVFVANSTFVAERVRGIYKRDALVIAPPVDIDRFRRVERKPDEWYLVVSALVPYKRVDHAIAACARLGRRLKIVGSGPEERNLRMLATNLRADVEFAGFVDDQDLGKYYGNARALLFPGVEDFGIVPVEAIASGCPVVALGIGGVLDSMTAETAVFYAEESVDGLARSIREFEDWCYDPVALRSRAEAFSETVFVNKFAEILSRGRFLG